MQPVYQLTNQDLTDLIRTGFQRSTADRPPSGSTARGRVQEDAGRVRLPQREVHHQPRDLANRVNRVTYEDGSQILVNYNPEPYSGPGGTSPPTATSCASHSRAGNTRVNGGAAIRPHEGGLGTDENACPP